MKTEETIIDSHIQMPKRVLKKFENKQHCFYRYDVRTGIIAKGYPKTTNTQKGFYSKEMEQSLNQNIEQPLDVIYKTINDISIDHPKGTIPSLLDYVAKRFVYALIARNPDNIDRVKAYRFLKETMSEQQLHDLGAFLGIAAELEREFLANWGTTIAVNRTETPFVLPTCGVYYLIIRNVLHLVLPVTPEKAVVFVEENGKDTIINNGIVHPYSIDNLDDIMTFNRNAFSTQILYGNGYVVSPQKELLEVLLNEIETQAQS